MTTSSLIIASLCFMSRLSIGIVTMIIHALRPAKPDANVVHDPSVPSSFLDPQMNVDSLGTSVTQLDSKPDAETINPYQPHTAAVATDSARQRPFAKST